jgi:hypothetical protein
MTTVFFATNRMAAGDPTQPSSYGAAMVGPDPALITYARAEVTNVALPDASSGIITQIADINLGGFSPALANAIVNGGATYSFSSTVSPTPSMMQSSALRSIASGSPTRASPPPTPP